jgi:AcrR family transcriptional regulator
MAEERATVPRGRHAPPLEVRLEVQRERLFEAAAAVFARSGYAEASAESISREAGMSKATFYEHFANKEECILALFDEGARTVLTAMAEATAGAGPDPADRMRAGINVFLEQLASHGNESQTLLVEIIGAGPRAIERRDAILQTFADALYEEAEHAARLGQSKRFQSREDAFAVIAAGAELASRHVRLGQPADPRELEPVLERLLLGALSQGR